MTKDPKPQPVEVSDDEMDETVGGGDLKEADSEDSQTAKKTKLHPRWVQQVMS